MPSALPGYKRHRSHRAHQKTRHEAQQTVVTTLKGTIQGRAMSYTNSGPTRDHGAIHANGLVMLREVGRGLRLTCNWLQICWLDQRKRILVTLETILSQVGEDDVGGQRERERAEFGLGTAQDPRVGLKPW